MYLDFGVRMSIDGFSCVCFQVREGLEQISSFLSAHAKEVIFLDFNHFYGVQNLHHEKLVAMLKEVFGEKLCPVVFAQEVQMHLHFNNAAPCNLFQGFCNFNNLCS